jgi:hypothetical protein
MDTFLLPLSLDGRGKPRVRVKGEPKRILNG